MPWPIMFKDEQVNQKEALWNRKPKTLRKSRNSGCSRLAGPGFLDTPERVPVNLRGISISQAAQDPDFFKGE